MEADSLSNHIILAIFSSSRLFSAMTKSPKNLTYNSKSPLASTLPNLTCWNVDADSVCKNNQIKLETHRILGLLNQGMLTKIVWYQTTWIIAGKEKILILFHVVSGNNFYQLSLWQVQKNNGQCYSKNVSGLRNLICGGKTLYRASLLPMHMEKIFLNILTLN